MADPVILQKGTILRVTANADGGGIRTSIDHNALYDIDMKDIIFLVGCIRQLEHKLLNIYNERLEDEESK